MRNALSRLMMAVASVLVSATAAPAQTVDLLAPPPAADPQRRGIVEQERLVDDGNFSPNSWSLVAYNGTPSPKAWVEGSTGFAQPGALALGGAGSFGAIGAWEREAPATGGQTYRVTAHQLTSAVPFPRQTSFVRLDWRDGAGRRPADPDYVAQSFDAGKGWRRIDWLFTAPPGAVKVRIQLHYQNCADGTVWWDDVRFARVAAPSPRSVKVATVYNRPSGLTPAGNIDSFASAIDRAYGATRASVFCLPEMCNVVGTGLSYVQAAEPIPGPSTNRLGQTARQYKAYIIAGLVERDPATGLSYTAAVLIDRQGEVAGKYRKIHLPIAEAEGGLVPGSEYRVFDTDFGRIGIEVCYDDDFPTTTALSLRGAEIVFLPIWGGNELLMQAHAVESRAWLVTSSYDSRTGIASPQGAFVATADRREMPTWAAATINLDQKTAGGGGVSPRTQYFAEQRSELPLRP